MRIAYQGEPGAYSEAAALRFTDRADLLACESFEQVFEAVDQGKAGAAWLLRGIPLPTVYQLASQGLAMPPKSTYFYPKVPSGLTINVLLSASR